MHQTPATTTHQSPTLNHSEVLRSFRLLAMDAIFYFCGLAFMDPSTVLPAFLATLTDSPVLIGALIAIRPAGVFIPQLWTAHFLRNRPRHKRFLIGVASVSRTAITFFAIMLFVAQPDSKTLMLASFIIMYIAFWFSEGGAGVPWTDLVAKTIPERLRGRLFGLMQVVGGILAVLSAELVRRMLSPQGPDYPTNYAVLMSVAAFFFWASLLSLSAVREPIGPVEEHDGGFIEYVAKLGQTLRDHGQLKRLIAIQLLSGLSGLSLPFYILYARDTAGISGGMVGTLLLVQTVGSILSALVAGYLSDHRGPKYAIMLTLILGILAPLVAIVVTDASVWVFGVIFLLVGGLLGCSWIGLTNYLLEMSDPRERRGFIGLMNTANTPAMLHPLLGGVIVQVVSYKAVFGLTFLAYAVAIVLAAGLKTKKAVATTGATNDEP